MNSWVWASTPTVTRICTRWRTPWRWAMWATRTISWKRVEHDPPDTGSLDGTLDLGDGLVVAVEGDAVGGHTGVEGGGQLPAGAHVQIQPFLLEPAHDGTREEGLAGVEDVGVGPEGVGPGAAAGPEVALVEEVGGGAELLGEPGDGDPADGEGAVRVTGDGARPDLLVQDVEVGGGRGVVPLGRTSAWRGPAGCAERLIVMLSRVSSDLVRDVRARGCRAGTGRLPAPSRRLRRWPAGRGGRPRVSRHRRAGAGRSREVEERVRDGFQLPGDPVGRAVTGPGEQHTGVVGDEVEEGAGGGVVGGRRGEARCSRRTRCSRPARRGLRRARRARWGFRRTGLPRR